MEAVCFICGVQAPFYTRKNAYAYHRCPDCHLIFLHPLPSLKETEGVYDEEYFHGAAKGFGYIDYEKNKKPMKGAFVRSLRFVEKLKTTAAKRLLDIGASTGYLMRLAAERGWETVGIEISSYATSCARKAGSDVHQGTLETVKLPPESFSAITLFDVFEHFRDPLLSLRTCHALLQHGGVLCINTPTADSVWARIFGREWHAILPPEHLFLFNRRNLTRLLRRTGFEVVLTTKIGKKFSLPYILQIASHWRDSAFLKKLADRMSAGVMGRIGIPLNLRDNVFVVARKL